MFIYPSEYTLDNDFMGITFTSNIEQGSTVTVNYFKGVPSEKVDELIESAKDVGIKKYESTSSYSTNELVVNVDNNNPQVYRSLADNNESALSDTTKWSKDYLGCANSALSNSPYTTNRILEIPQDIKLELSNGTLTLKAGSKIYVPNGFESDGTTPHFDIITTTNDLSTTPTVGASTNFIRYQNGELFADLPVNTFSSGADSTGHTGWFYNTTTNTIRYYTNGTPDSTNRSFPLGISINSSSNVTTSIDQVFNGFGYIGSTVFVIKDGIKVQMPNGRSSDGTCRASIVSHSGVITQTFTNTNDILFDVFVAEGQTYCLRSPAGENLYYDSERNLMIDAGLPSDRFVIGKAFFKGGRCYSVTPLTTDLVVNSNASNFSQAGRSEISRLASISKRGIQLTLGASGSQYVMPANGRLCLKVEGGGCQIYVSAHEQNSKVIYSNSGSSAGTWDSVVAKVTKGDLVTIYYGGSNQWFYLAYDNGEV